MDEKEKEEYPKVLARKIQEIIQNTGRENRAITEQEASTVRDLKEELESLGFVVEIEQGINMNMKTGSCSITADVTLWKPKINGPQS